MLYTLNTIDIDTCYSRDFNNQLFTLGDSGNILSYGEKHWIQYRTPEYIGFNYISLF